MSSLRSVLGLFAMLSLAGASISTAAVLCKTSDDTLKVRDTACKNREIRIDPASLGLQGPPGPRGFRGPQGPAGPLPRMNAVIRSSQIFVQNGEGSQIRRVDCLPGEVAIGGGHIWNILALPTGDLPLSDGVTSSWGVLTSNLENIPPATLSYLLTIYAVCVSLVP